MTWTSSEWSQLRRAVTAADVHGTAREHPELGAESVRGPGHAYSTTHAAPWAKRILKKAALGASDAE